MGEGKEEEEEKEEEDDDEGEGICVSTGPVQVEWRAVNSPDLDAADSHSCAPSVSQTPSVAHQVCHTCTTTSGRQHVQATGWGGDGEQEKGKEAREGLPEAEGSVGLRSWAIQLPVPQPSSEQQGVIHYISANDLSHDCAAIQAGGPGEDGEGCTAVTVGHIGGVPGWDAPEYNQFPVEVAWGSAGDRGETLHSMLRALDANLL